MAAVKTTNSGKKRKSKENSWKKAQVDYFQRLLFSAKKSLRKQSKLVRNLESQKMVRKLKERKSKAIEESYQQLKNLNLEHVVQESLRRLGILHLDPKLAEAVAGTAAGEESEPAETEAETEASNSPTEEAAAADTPPATTEDENKNRQEDDSEKSANQNAKSTEPSAKEKELIEKILQHKKMQSALEEWNDKVTEYRRWTLQQQDREDPRRDKSEIVGSKKSKKRKMAAIGDSNASAREGQKSMFFCLGNEDDDPGEDDDGMNMPHYGPGSVPEERKKNRMGQRQRKAKQNAIRAKQSGRLHRAADSLNWRPKKNKQPSEEEQQKGSHRGGSSGGGAVAAQSKDKAQKTAAVGGSNEKLHPSWAAAKKESSGIVQFQGKKITF